MAAEPSGHPDSLGVTTANSRRLLRRIEPEEMGSAPVPRTLITLALPAAGAGILQTAFEFVDILFITRLGTEQVSGVALAAPIMMAVWAIGSATAVGVGALYARRLGEEDRDGARETLNHGLGLAMIIGGAITLLGPPMAHRMLVALNATDNVLMYGQQFLGIILYSAFLMHVGMVADTALRAQGNSITPLKVLGAGNLVNIALEALMIFGLRMGVPGAALATLIARTGMALVLLSRLWMPYSRVVPGRVPGRKLFGSLPTIAGIYWIGLPASLSMLAMSFSITVLNNILLSLNTLAVGVMGIAWRLEMFAFTPIFGLFSAVVPMVAYNLGARKFDRCAGVVRSACWIAATAMGTLGLFLFTFPRTFMKAFGNDPTILDMGSQYLRINCWAYPMIACDIMISAGFQGLGKSYLAMIAQTLRNLVLKIGGAWILAGIAGVAGVWWSFPLSTIGSLMVAATLMTVTLRRLNHVPSVAPAVEMPSVPQAAPSGADPPQNGTGIA